MNRVQRDRLRELSLELFGKTSVYQRLLEGINEPVTRDEVKEIPGETAGAPAVTTTVKIPVIMNGVPVKRTVFYTPEAALIYLENMKKEADEVKAKIKQHQDEVAAKKAQEELAKHVQEEARGSAV